MSDVENVDIMLGSYSREDERNQGESEFNLDSGSTRPQQSSNLVGKDFKSLLKMNSRYNSEMTNKTTRLIIEEISKQLSRKLNVIKSSLNSQIQDAITTAITERVLPSIQNTLDTHGRANLIVVGRGFCGLQVSPRTTDFTVAVRRSSGLQRNPEDENTQKTWEIRPKTCFTQEHCRRMSKESSVDFYIGEQNRDSFKIRKVTTIVCGFLRKAPTS